MYRTLKMQLEAISSPEHEKLKVDLKDVASHFWIGGNAKIPMVNGQISWLGSRELVKEWKAVKTSYEIFYERLQKFVMNANTFIHRSGGYSD